MFFTGKVVYYDEFDNETTNYGFLLEAENYGEAMEKLVHHYGEREMPKVELRPFSGWSVLDTKDMDFYDYMIKEFEKTDLW